MAAVIARHASAFSRPEFLKAVRALSSRYVEARARLTSRSPLDTAGKRAAFAGFYAPLHYLTVQAIVRALDLNVPPSRLIDLGCGTGVGAAAWATCVPAPPAIVGIDQNAWVLGEMRWNGQTLGLRCRTERASMTSWLEANVTAERGPNLQGVGIVCAWSLNELAAPDSGRVLQSLLTAHARQASILIVEPVASSVVPWWDSWRARIEAAGGRADEWRFPPALPAVLADLDEAAGFRREHLTARSLWLDGALATGHHRPATESPRS